MIASARGAVISTAIPMNARAPTNTMISSAMSANLGAAPPRPIRRAAARMSMPTKTEPTTSTTMSPKVRGTSPLPAKAVGCSVMTLTAVVDASIATA